MKREKVSGIYQILNRRTGRMYIGKSVNVYGRWRTHLTQLESFRHDSTKLQMAWYLRESSDELVMNILERFSGDTTESEMHSRVTDYIIHYASDVLGYNASNNTNKRVYNGKYDEELHKKLSRKSDDIQLFKSLIRQYMKENPKGITGFDCDNAELSEYFVWIDSLVEFTPSSVVEKYVPPPVPLKDQLYAIHKYGDSEYVFKLKGWRSKNLFMIMLNELKKRGGKYNPWHNAIVFMYDPDELPLVDIIQSCEKRYYEPLLLGGITVAIERDEEIINLIRWLANTKDYNTLYPGKLEELQDGLMNKSGYKLKLA